MNEMLPGSNFHSREAVRRLQHAHAAHIESIYTGLATIPENPYQIDIGHIGQTRYFCANVDRLENRAIFSGNESLEEFEAVTSYFDRRQRRCFVEINPGNFYRTEPFSWKSEVMPILLDLGYRAEDFRCVWHYAETDKLIQTNSQEPRIEMYDNKRLEQFIPLRMQVESVSCEEHAAKAAELRFGEAADGWFHYIGFKEGDPVSTSTLFVHDGNGYLAWGFTDKRYRKQGHQTAHILRRIKDAQLNECQLIFTVSDFNIGSARNLQKCGFTLAYNYILMVR